MVRVKIKQFLLIICVVTSWEAKKQVTASSQTGGPLDFEQSDITDTELQNHENRHAVPEAHLGNGNQHSDHKTASADNGLTSVSQNDRNQISTRQTPIEINTGKTTQQQSSCQSHSPVYTETMTADDNSSHDDKEHTLTMTSVLMYGQRSNTVKNTSLDGMWMERFEEMKSTESKVRLKRIKRNAAPLNLLAVRKPVTMTRCRCPCCSSSTSAFDRNKFENAVFNKPATSSSRFALSQSAVTLPGCGGVNGFTANNKLGMANEACSTSPNCFFTAGHDNHAWWSVDMQYVYTVSSFSLHVYKGERKPFLLGGLDVLVDGQLCFDFYKSLGLFEAKRRVARINPGDSITCKQVLTGRVMRFQKRFEDLGNFQRFLGFCELQVWVCKSGTYGQFPGGCNPCPSSCKYTCDNHYGCNRRVVHNAAVYQRVSTSPTRYGSPQHLVDTVQASNVRECIQTAFMRRLALHWVYVTLATPQLVYYVVVSGRRDCCSENELRDFYVSVMAIAHEPTHPPPQNEICAHHVNRVPTKGKANLTCSHPMWGQRVLVSRKTTANLALCELEVFARYKFALGVGAKCDKDSGVYFCVGNATCDNSLCKLTPCSNCTSSSQCVSQGFCEQGFCKLRVNAKCDVSKSEHCSIGQTCDTKLKKCRIVTNGRCASSSGTAVCVHDNVCDTDGTCRVQLGKSCTSNGQCLKIATCQSGKCYIPLNGDCSTANCHGNQVCDNINGDKRCRMPLKSQCTRGQIICQHMAVCDRITLRCMTKAQAACSDSKQCLSGATCSGGKCTCNTNVANHTNDECEPFSGRLGARCSANTECLSGQCENKFCICKSSETASGRDFSCSVTVAKPCANDEECSEGLKCEGGKCKLKIGDFCFSSKQSCVSGAICEDFICKLNAGKNCAAHESNCISRAVCTEGICKIQLGQKCTASSGCAFGVCSAPDNSTCRLDVGQSCSGQNELCRTGTSCEGSQTCKLNVGQECALTTQCSSRDMCIARQGSSKKKCRKPLGGVDCRSDDDCGVDTVCDSLKECRLAKDKDCERNPGLCLTGALCVEGKCLCNPKMTKPGTSKCDPNPNAIGDRCKDDGPKTCTDPVGHCREGICQCEGTFAIDQQKLSCGIQPGFRCSSTVGPISCITGASCVDGLCLLDAGESCVGDRQGVCNGKSVCDRDSICRLNINQNCTGQEKQCKQGTVCDNVRRCKAKPGEYCAYPMDCMTGSNCVNHICFCTEGVATLKDGSCSVNDGHVGGNCNQGGSCLDPLAKCNLKTKRCECSPGYTPDPGWLKCVNAIGEKCKSDSQCLNATHCDTFKNKCLLNLGQLCEGDNENNCITGTVCDASRVCKLDMKGNCSGENRGLCKVGTFCDWLEQCSIGVEETCTEALKEDKCVAGGHCLNSSCACDAKVSSENGAVCEPKAGRFGSKCEITGSKCYVDNSVCGGQICGCAPGYRPNQLFECVSAAASTGEAKQGGTVVAVSTLVALVGLLVLIGMFVGVRHRQQREKADTAFAERRGSMVAIRKLSQSLGAPSKIQSEATSLSSAFSQRDEETATSMAPTESEVGTSVVEDTSTAAASSVYN